MSQRTNVLYRVSGDVFPSMKRTFHRGLLLKESRVLLFKMLKILQHSRN